MKFHLINRVDGVKATLEDFPMYLVLFDFTESVVSLSLSN